MCVCMGVCFSTIARLTHANNLLDVNAANINLLGKLMDGLIGVFIGERVHVDFDSCQEGEARERRRRRRTNAEDGVKH